MLQLQRETGTISALRVSCELDEGTDEITKNIERTPNYKGLCQLCTHDKSGSDAPEISVQTANCAIKVALFTPRGAVSCIKAIEELDGGFSR